MAKFRRRNGALKRCVMYRREGYGRLSWIQSGANNFAHANSLHGSTETLKGKTESALDKRCSVTLINR